MTPGRQTRPWYRHAWPWILMAGPFIVILAGAVTVYLAVVSNDGLVDDDYYVQGMSVNKTTAREKNALALGVQAELMQSEMQAGKAAAAKLRVLLRANAGVALPATLSLRIQHPTRAGFDQTVALKADGPGAYSGTLASVPAGRWRVAIEDGEHKWRLAGDWLVGQQPVLHLPDRASASLQ